MKNSACIKNGWQKYVRYLALLTVLVVPPVGACSSPGGQEDALNVSRSALVSISGTVRDGSGNPVPNVDIQLLDGGGDKIGSGVSAADGKYTLAPSGADIPDGMYDIVVTPPADTIFVPQTFADEALSGATTFDIVLVNARTFAVAGRIVNSGSTPLAGQSVCLNGQGENRCVQTLSDGTFSVTVGPGTYSMRVSGYLLPPTETEDGDESFARYVVTRNTQLTVNADVPLGDIIIGTYTLSGNVRNSGGQPIGGATVGGALSAAFGSFNGSFFFSQVTSASTGTVGDFQTVAVLSSGSVNATASGYPLGTASLSSGQANVTITLPPVVTVTGRVRDAGNNALVGQSVCLNGQGENRCAQTLSDGTFSVTVGPGTYSMRVSGYLLPPTETEDGDESFARYVVTRNTQLTVNADVPLGDITIETRSLSGQVVDPDGQPVPRATVGGALSAAFGSFNGSFFFSQVTGVDGRIETIAVPSAGTFRISPRPASGLVPFNVSGVIITNDYAVGVSTQFLTETVSAVIGGDEKLTTDEGDDQATPSDPVETTIILASFVSPQLVSIEEVPVTAMPPLGYFFLTQQINITAPGSSDPNDPLEINFRIDCSRFFPALCNTATANGVVMFRNGQPSLGLPTCNAPGVADPPTCIDDRTILDVGGNRVAEDPTGQGDVAIKVLTLAASYWTFAFKLDDDADGDRIPDADDACPDEPEDIDGRQDTDGCPELEDADNDGIEDFVDTCPMQAEDLDGNADSDGCPETEDADGDGIDDALDACPMQAEDLDGNADSDGCPEVDDTDGDGIPDGADQCPYEAEDLDGHADDDGCPESEPEPVPCADFDGDGIVTKRDIAQIKSRVRGHQSAHRPRGYDPRFDLNRDGVIDVHDLVLANDQLGHHC